MIPLLHSHCHLNFDGLFQYIITGMASSSALTDSDALSMSHRLTVIEMKELNERQRAEHAHRMYEQQKSQLRQLEDRNFELEQKFAEVNYIFFL